MPRQSARDDSPPRPLAGTPEQAWGELRERLVEFAPFEIELGGVEIFPETQVIYIALAAGRGSSVGCMLR
jgi:hypothetical protein